MPESALCGALSSRSLVEQPTRSCGHVSPACDCRWAGRAARSDYAAIVCGISSSVASIYCGIISVSQLESSIVVPPGLVAYVLIAVATLAGAFPVAAQSLHASGVDVAVAVHRAFGGQVRDRSGIRVDVAGTAQWHTTEHWALMGAAGAGVALASSPFRVYLQDCVVLASGRCAPRGNFQLLYAMAGSARAVGTGAVRACLGPSLVRSASTTSLGVQAQLDGRRPIASHVGLGALLRAVYAPSHGGQRLVLVSGGASLGFR